MAENIRNLKVPASYFSKVLPQSYDDTLTFYEYMNKLYYAFNHIADYSFSLNLTYTAETKNLDISLKSNEEEA